MIEELNRQPAEVAKEETVRTNPIRDAELARTNPIAFACIDYVNGGMGSRFPKEGRSAKRTQFRRHVFSRERTQIEVMRMRRTNPIVFGCNDCIGQGGGPLPHARRGQLVFAKRSQLPRVKMRERSQSVREVFMDP